MIRLDPYHPTSGRADYGDATTVSLIEELADILAKAEEWDGAVYKRMTSEQKEAFGALFAIDYRECADRLRKYADDWQAHLDAEEDAP